MCSYPDAPICTALEAYFRPFYHKQVSSRLRPLILFFLLSRDCQTARKVPIKERISPARSLLLTSCAGRGAAVWATAGRYYKMQILPMTQWSRSLPTYCSYPTLVCEFAFFAFHFVTFFFYPSSTRNYLGSRCILTVNFHNHYNKRRKRLNKSAVRRVISVEPNVS